MSNGNGKSELTETGAKPTEAELSEMDFIIERALRNDGLRDDELPEVGWNRYRVLLNALKDSENKDIAEDVRLLIRFASATHQYLRREKELDYVMAAFQDLPLGPKGIHF